MQHMKTLCLILCLDYNYLLLFDFVFYNIVLFIMIKLMSRKDRSNWMTKLISRKDRSNWIKAIFYKLGLFG